MDVISAQVLNQILSYRFVLKCDKPKASRLPIINIFQDNSTFDGSILREMLLKIHICKFEV
jgi:hypothetical protein